jgi:hypothetical protein
MKKFLLAALFALPLTALAGQRASAGDCCTPLYRIGFSVGIVYRGWCGCDYSCCKAPVGTGLGSGKCGGGGCGSGCSFPGGGPWYGYWPYPAHFQTPAPTGFPYWPAPMTYGGYSQAPVPTSPPAMAQMPGMEYYGNAAASIPMGGNFGGYPSLQTVGYNAQVPAYWQMGR